MSLRSLGAALALSLPAAALAAPAMAQPAAPRTIVVSGDGEATAAPDMATLTIGVQTEAKTAAEALSQNAARMDAAIKKLKQRGVDEKDIQTSGLSVSPQYDYDSSRPRSEPRITGYMASNNVVVKLRKLDKAGSIIDDAISGGANSMSGLSFGFADLSPLLKEARRNAVKDARERAELYADAAGVKLGPVLRISDTFDVQPGPMPYAEVAAMDAKVASTPVSVGESSISARVTVVYGIE